VNTTAIARSSFPKGFISLYVVGAIAVAFLSLGAYGLYQRGNAANARAESAEALVESYKADLAASEADKALLREMQRKLDVAVRERDKRYDELQKAKNALAGEYAKLRDKVDEVDKNCLDRELPDSFRERLRE
jgi:hypothetical protein